MEDIFLFGAGGHAKVVASIVEVEGLYRLAVVVDDDPGLEGADFYGYPVLGGREALVAGPAASRIKKGLVGIGANPDRMRVAKFLEDAGLAFVTAVHPSAQIARGASIDAGTVVMAGAVINADATIGRLVIVNTGATIDHDCVIGDGAHIAPGCHLCGNVTVGAGAVVGAGTTVVPGVAIGTGAMIGAGSVLIRDVAAGETVTGNPGRALLTKPKYAAPHESGMPCTGRTRGRRK